jgi:glyoxylase-like metal-dependent hydrolase (beta-lactamase superfamily II)/rhodanese-related sulfurtransferase
VEETTGMYTQQFFIEGLACASYLVGCDSQGVAAVIDSDRIVQKYLDAAQARGLQITHIIETHLHADHVSGNTDLAARTGADIYIHEAGEAEFPHKPLTDGEVIELGYVRIQVMHTPGHTPESVTLLIADTTRSPEPWLAMTGDTLFVGDIGRPDLVGPEAARGLAGDMYESLFHRILPLGDSLLVYPGHGAGSLCGKSIGAMRSTTLGFERRYNLALAPRDQASFVDFAVNDLPEQPGNHRRIKAMNRMGPEPVGEVEEQPLTVRQAVAHLQQGAVLLDTRPKKDYSEAHIPGSVHLEADSRLGNRIGFMFSSERPVILLLDELSQYREIFHNLLRVGYDNILGYLAESLESWQELGLPIASGDIQDIEPLELHLLLQTVSEGESPLVLDVREPWEFRRGHVPGARLIPLGQLAERIGELEPERPVAVICASGNRSQSAAAMLGQRDFQKVFNVVGGTNAWKQAGLEISRES